MNFVRKYSLMFLTAGLLIAGYFFIPQQRAAAQQTGENPSFQVQSHKFPGESSGTVVITGMVINGSGGSVPKGSTVHLVIYQKDRIFRQYKCGIDGSGYYSLSNIPWKSDFIYITSVSYNGIMYYSDSINAEQFIPDQKLELPLIVYENSTNSQFLRALRMRAYFDFTDPGLVHIVETFLISNPTSLVIIPASESVPVLNFALPEGAQDVVFPEGNEADRFRSTGKGFGDWQPVMPGDGHQVSVEYTLPFTGQRTIFLLLPIAADSIAILVRSGEITLLNPDLEKVSTEVVDGETVTVYNGSALKAGGKLSLVFSTREHLYKDWIGGIIFFFTMLVVSIWLLRHRRQLKKGVRAEQHESVDTILDSIITLEDRYKAGELNEVTYRQMRAELISQMDESKQNPPD